MYPCPRFERSEGIHLAFDRIPEASMKKAVFWVGILFVLSQGVPSMSQEVIDGIVAIVGDEIILRTELLQVAQLYAAQQGINPLSQPEAFEELKKVSLESLIDQKVLLARAEEDTITVEDQQLEAELEARIQEFVRQLGSRERVEAYFGSPIKKIKKDYREEVRKNLIIQTLQQKKLSNVQISRREVEAFFESKGDSLPEVRPMVKLRHILLEIRPGEDARKDAVARIREVQERLRQGEDFEELARQYSEDSGTADRGGALGFVERGTLFQSFEEAAFQLQPGEVSAIVETPVGLHLIQMVEKRGDKASLRHILVRLDTGSRDAEEIRERITDIRERAAAGEDFGELAKEYSEDLSTKEEGGDLGWLPVEEFQIQAFREVADTLQVDEISQPFQTQFGYHIVMLEGRRPARKLSLEEDWEQIKEWAWNVKRQGVMKEWIQEIRRDIYIEIKEDVL